MRNAARWAPTKFEVSGGRLRGSRDSRELGVGSRLVTDLVAAHYDRHLRANATGRLLDLGCGKAPLYAAYAPYVSDVVCVDWAPGDHVDVQADLTEPLPFGDGQFDTIILSDVLEHIPQPEELWREMTRVLAPRGTILMNVPFYYAVHAHPHDYYRYTTFALQRFVQLNGLELSHVTAIGGLVDIIADITGKSLSGLGPLGRSLAALSQSLAFRFGRTRLGQRVRRASSRDFPLGYFMIARRPG
jgi:SAM-dependent methyltransferase